MNSLIIIGMVVAVIFVVIRGMVTSQAPAPSIIYVQAAPTDVASGAGCLPLILLLGRRARTQPSVWIGGVPINNLQKGKK